MSSLAAGDGGQVMLKALEMDSEESWKDGDRALVMAFGQCPQRIQVKSELLQLLRVLFPSFMPTHNCYLLYSFPEPYT